MMQAPTSRPSRTSVALAAAALAVSAALISGSTGQDAEARETSRSKRAPKADRAGYADMLEPLLPSVVNISSTSPGGDNEGSGVIIRSEGILLTNYHVVEEATNVQVTFSDGRQWDAEILGEDPASDLAVLRVPARDLPALQFGTAADLRIGDLVFAIGNPLGIGQSVSMGIVSAKQRSVNINQYENFIQTDAAINPGNSGGALVDTNGRLVGINSALVHRGNPGYSGIGLAIPAEMARDVAEQLLDQGRVQRARLGVYLEDVDPRLARHYGLEPPRGTLITRVIKGEPAERAGLKRHDLVLTMNGEAVDSMQNFRLAISNRRPGERVELGVLRDGKPETVTAVLAALESQSGSSAKKSETRARDLLSQESKWGLELSPLDGEARSDWNLPAETKGLIVMAVADGSAAARAGLRPGSLILKAEGESVSSVAELRRVAARSESDSLLLLVRSRRGEQLVVLEP